MILIQLIHLILACSTDAAMELAADRRGGGYLMLVAVVMVYATPQPYRLRYCSEPQAQVCFLPEYVATVMHR